jgi:hypothetical protein
MACLEHRKSKWRVHASTIWIPDADAPGPALADRSCQPRQQNHQQGAAIEQQEVVAQIREPKSLRFSPDGRGVCGGRAPGGILRQRHDFPAALQVSEQRKHRQQHGDAQQHAAPGLEPWFHP